MRDGGAGIIDACVAGLRPNTLSYGYLVLDLVSVRRKAGIGPGSWDL